MARRVSKRKRIRLIKKPAKTRLRHKTKHRIHRVKSRKPKRPQVTRQFRFSSLNEVLLHNILKNEGSQKANEEAALIIQLITSVTTNMCDFSFREGLSIGKTLYGICAYYNPKGWYEDYVLELAQFFEKAGYSGATYNIFPDKITFEIYGKSNNLGANVHSFEAGMISGFITAARGVYTQLQEIECRYNGAKNCRFSTPFQYNIQPPPQPPIKELMHKLAVQLNSLAIEKGGPPLPNLSGYYYTLLVHNLLAREYVKAFKPIYSFLGESILQQKLQDGRSKFINAKYIENVLKLLHLGNPKIESLKPVKAQITFSKLNSKKDMVELCIEFLNGLLGEIAKKTVAIESNRKDAYTLRLRSETARRTHK